MILETERLFLREMSRDDYDALYAVLADPVNMQHYPCTFDGARVRDWIERNRERYEEDGFGLWAVCLRDTGEVIGDCGLTLQNMDGECLPEIGYHIRRDCQRKGYAKKRQKPCGTGPFRIRISRPCTLTVSIPIQLRSGRHSRSGCAMTMIIRTGRTGSPVFPSCKGKISR